MIAQLAVAQLRLEEALTALRSSGDAGGLREGEAQRGELSALRAAVATASPSALAALRTEVQAVVAAATASARQLQSGATGRSAENSALENARGDARRQTQAVMAGMKDFDYYLHFASAEDERAYREREAERHAYIETEQKKGSAQGDLNATEAAIAQMDDAKAHGAGDSPLFTQRMGSLTAARDKLRGEMRREDPEHARNADRATDASGDGDLGAAMAALSAAGVQQAGGSAPATGHGLATQAPSTAVAAR